METIKLQKYLSDCGIMSRRAAEAEIAAGKVRVNGIPASLGDRVEPLSDTVEYEGRVVKRSSSVYTYLALNKPAGYVTTLSDEKGRKTVADLVADVPQRVYPVGRLDQYSDGLILLTDDGAFANRMMHPSHDIPKQYRATVTAHLTEDDIAELRVPFKVDGYLLRPFEVAFFAYTKCGNADGTILTFTLHEGRNREIRRICEHHGLRVARLTRISIGEVLLGSLPSGKWRRLTDTELCSLSPETTL